MTFRMPDSWYDPPEEILCCAVCEDEEDHDRQACMDAQAEDAAEARAERMREDEMFDRDEVWL